MASEAHYEMQHKNLVKCLVACVVATAGNTITASEPDKEAKMLVYAEARRYAVEGRLNVDYSAGSMQQSMNQQRRISLVARIVTQPF